ncbi:MFS transporter [Streptomyces sp. Act143]|uniref:MFS transporter n=1 Tax=Streptomyces sp. Act143 TaxID=2200760 RepID=UPI000D676DE5|nr:MFS transporter [Streptomyces sp. Act143]PWI17113.1 MFS transporter [Streptomyces sp. Act143]
MSFSAPPAPDMTTYNPRRWAAFVVTLSAAFMDLVDTTVINVALPSLRRDLDASSTQLEWAVAGYVMAFAAGMITAGRLGDRFGRLRVFQGGLAAFVVTSALTGLAVNAEMLVAARVAQGASAAMMVPQVLAMLRVEFPPEEQHKAATLFGLNFSVGGVAGPLIGGVILDADLFGLDWRPIFFINVPIGIAALIGTFVLCRDSRAQHAATTDVRGLAIATCAVLALLYPLVEGRTMGWPWWTWALMAACPVLLWLFGRYEKTVVRRGHAPLIDPGLLRERAPMGGLSVAVLFFAGTGYTLVITVHLQSGLGYSPLHTALTMVPFAVGVGLFSPFAPKIRPYGRPVAVVGSLLAAIGMAGNLLAVRSAGEDLHSWQLVPGMLVTGLGVSMTSGVLIATVLAKTPGRLAGSAAALVNTAIQIGVAVGIAVVGTVFFGSLDDDGKAVDAAAAGLLTVVVLYLLASPAALILPPGRLMFAAAGNAKPPRQAGPADERDGAEDKGETGSAAPADEDAASGSYAARRTAD